MEEQIYPTTNISTISMLLILTLGSGKNYSLWKPHQHLPIQLQLFYKINSYFLKNKCGYSRQKESIGKLMQQIYQGEYGRKQIYKFLLLLFVLVFTKNKYWFLVNKIH